MILIMIMILNMYIIVVDEMGKIKRITGNNITTYAYVDDNNITTYAYVELQMITTLSKTS